MSSSFCDSWYTKQNLVSIVDEYPNRDLIGNARIDSVMYDPAPAHTDRRGRPAKHGKRLSVETDFAFQVICWLYYIGATPCDHQLFGCREIGCGEYNLSLMVPLTSLRHAGGCSVKDNQHKAKRVAGVAIAGQ